MNTHDFIRDNEQVEFLDQLGDLQVLFTRECLANGVVRCVQHDDLGPWRNGASRPCKRGRFARKARCRLPQFIEIKLPVITRYLRFCRVRAQGNVDAFAAVEHNRCEILVEERLEQNDFVPLVEERGKDGVLACKADYRDVRVK